MLLLWLPALLAYRLLPRTKLILNLHVLHIPLVRVRRESSNDKNHQQTLQSLKFKFRPEEPDQKLNQKLQQEEESVSTLPELVRSVWLQTKDLNEFAG